MISHCSVRYSFSTLSLSLHSLSSISFIDFFNFWFSLSFNCNIVWISSKRFSCNLYCFSISYNCCSLKKDNLSAAWIVSAASSIVLSAVSSFRLTYDSLSSFYHTRNSNSLQRSLTVSNSFIKEETVDMHLFKHWLIDSCWSIRMDMQSSAKLISSSY